MSPSKKFSSFSEILQEEQSANRRVEISSERIGADPKFNAANIFNSILEKNRQRVNGTMSYAGLRASSEN